MPEGPNIELIVGAPLEKRKCPYIQPVQTIHKLTGAMQLHFIPCLGQRCQLWDQCQGDLSPKAQEERRSSRMILILQAIEEASSAIPFAGAAKGVLGKLRERLLSGFKSA